MHAQQPFDRAHLVANALQRGIDGGKSASAGLIERLALHGGPDHAGRALQQARADMPLEIAQMLGDGGLRHGEIARRGGHRAALDSAQESPEGDGDIHA